MNRTFLLILFSTLTFTAFAQSQNNLTDLNDQRIQTNKTGMTVLGGWAAANIVSGTAGYFIAQDEEWKAFHGMNAMWNVVNGVIAYSGYRGALKEQGKKLSGADAYSRYESNKRLFLLNAGLDIAYIGSGLLLNAYAGDFNNPAEWRGFGKSVALQGVFLLLFDGTMYAVHQSRNKSWYKILSGVSFTGNGIGYNYRF